jgi:thiosulfate/3-mercaptopyruvate sulfurtransferase
MLVTRLSLLAIILAAAVFVSGQKPAPAADDLQLGGPNVIQPEQLVKMMQTSPGQKPVVLYVGPPIFYAQAHIRGAANVGPAASPKGLEKLRAHVAKLARNQLVVIYCGCCPWTHCPNIHPAYQELRKMGFSNVRALYLETSFGTNWADKGYPVEKGE